MKKQYQPQDIEKKWTDWWEERGYFSPQPARRKATFSIVMPPPNITGSLHMGHAFDITLQDILTRFKRMQGYETLWLPGTDHAGIATQNVVEKGLAKEGLSRQKLGREKFLERVWQWKEKYGERIFSQLRSLGASCSWKDKSFTMDEEHSAAVRQVFIQLYKEGYIYRGDYIINWCPRCETALSDIEVEYEEIKGKLYYIRYPFKEKEGKDYLVVATTRPETMLGDTGVAVNPGDERFKKLGKKHLILPLVGRVLPLILDEYVDPEFGTGALKVTPAHDPNDFLMGKKHNLTFINVLNKDGTINENGGVYQGLDRYECRRKLLADLKQQNYLEKVEDYTYRIGSCYRCQTPVEPYLSRQWFVRMKDLAKEAIRLVKKKQIEFVPSHWKKNYLRWLENIHDWCISRQIWWGHQLPVWYCEDCGEPTVAEETPGSCSACGKIELRQDEDVLDTWFSSSLWPFTTLGWPKGGEKLEKFYPTSVLCTGWDILFFWVARMIMMGFKFTGKVPFYKVYIHPLIGDEKRQKMSKSKGNVIDPLKIMEKYGTDAFRFSLVSPQSDSPYLPFSKDRVRGYRNFANKIWNASRFVLMNLEGFSPREKLEDLKSVRLSDKWILSRYSSLVKEVTSHLEHFKFSEAAHSLYQFIWGEFCDWYIELVKPRLSGKEGPSSRCTAQWILYYILKGTLKLLHPFMPFITEEIYQRLPEAGESIMLSTWPEIENGDSALLEKIEKIGTGYFFPLPCGEREGVRGKAEEEMNLLIKLIQEVRTVRSEMMILPSKKIDLWLRTSNEKNLDILKENKPEITNLVKAKKLAIDKGITKPALSTSSLVEDVEIFISLKGLIDLDKEKKRLRASLEKLDKDLSISEKKLSNANFFKRAPSKIVEKEKERKEAFIQKRERLRKRLEEASSPHRGED